MEVLSVLMKPETPGVIKELEVPPRTPSPPLLAVTARPELLLIPTPRTSRRSSPLRGRAIPYRARGCYREGADGVTSGFKDVKTTLKNTYFLLKARWL